MAGVSKDIFLARAKDPDVHACGQDGGLVSALLLWALEHEEIDAALASALEGHGTDWKAVPAAGRKRRASCSTVQRKENGVAWS